MWDGDGWPNLGIDRVGRVIGGIGGHKSFTDCLLGDWPLLPRPLLLRIYCFFFFCSF